MVRLAFGKYGGKGVTYTESLEHLVIHLKKNYKLKEWQSWRERELWTLEVADVLDANIDALKRLHTRYFSPT